MIQGLPYADNIHLIKKFSVNGTKS